MNIRIRPVLAVLFLMGIFVYPAIAVSPSEWTVRGLEAFSQGELDGVYVDPENVLRLGPKLTPVWEGKIPFVWCAKSAEDGTLYLGTGHDGDVYRINRKGTVERFWDGPTGEVFALEILPDGSVVAGVSPGALLYRLRPKAEPELIADLDAEYIWDLLLIDRTLYAATGSSDLEKNGVIYAWNTSERNTPPRPFYHSDDPHILTLERAASRFAEEEEKGLFYAGTQGRGLLIRVDGESRGRILFDTPEDEVTDIALAPDGTILVSTIVSQEINFGGEGAGAVPGESMLPPNGSQEDGEEEKGQQKRSGNENPSGTGAPSAPLYGMGGGRVYRVDPSFDIDLVFISPQGERVNALEFIEEKLWIGTSQGHVYRLDEENKASLIVKLDEDEVLNILPAGILTTGGTGGVYRVSSEKPDQGTYLSDVLDTLSLAHWGALSWIGGGDLEIFVRTGNTEIPGEDWMDWSPVDESYENITHPPSRFLQFKVILKKGKSAPYLRQVDVSYQIPNQRPRLDRGKLEAAPMVTLVRRDPSFLGKAGELGGIFLQVYQLMQSQEKERSIPVEQIFAPIRPYVFVQWAAQDYDEDLLVYDLSLRREGEENKAWREVALDYRKTYYFLNSELYPDGRYEVKVTASDRESNPGEFVRTDEIVSAPFTIDNTPPEVVFAAKQEQENLLRVSGTARDKLSPIASLEYSVNGREWILLRPVDGIVDQPSEDFGFVLEKKEEIREIVVKAVDAMGNHRVERRSFSVSQRD